MAERTERRVEDSRMSALVLDVSDLKQQMARNTEITEQVRDILTSFRVIAAAAKWVTAIVAACVALWHGGDSVKQWMK